MSFGEDAGKHYFNAAGSTTVSGAWCTVSFRASGFTCSGFHDACTSFR
jgi:hypothetical protein